MNFTVSSTALLNRLQIIGKTINQKPASHFRKLC